MTESRKVGGSNTGSRALSAAEKQEQALILRRSGATLSEIAKRLGYAGHQGAAKAIESALDKTLHYNADALRSLELDRLDRMQLGLWQRATQGDVQAIREVIRIMVRRAKLLGLDAPTKHENTHEISYKGIAQAAAEKYGLDHREVLAEAERIIAEMGTE